MVSSFDVVPWHYNTTLTFRAEEDDETFEGLTIIRLAILFQVKNITLHAGKLTIDESATLLIGADGNVHTPVITRTDNELYLLTLEFATMLLPGNYILQMEFTGCTYIPEAGIYRWSYLAEEQTREYMFMAHRGPSSIRRIFPCWDDPEFKATFEISIRHKRKYIPLSNIPIRVQTDEGNDTMLTCFEITREMSPFYVTFAIVTTAFIRTSNEDVSLWYRRSHTSNVTYTQEVAARFKQLLTEYTNYTVAIPEINLIFMPSDLSDEDIEPWGLMLCNCVYEEGKHNVILKHKGTEKMLTEMAYQCVTGTIDPSSWNQLALHERLIQFVVQYIIIDQMFPDLRKRELFVVDIYQKALHNDIANSMRSVMDDVSIPSEIMELCKSTQNKVLSILRMLYHILTGDVFREGFIKYLTSYQYMSANTQNMWESFQEALNESNIPHDDFDVQVVMNGWLSHKHYSVVHVSRDFENGDVILQQNCHYVECEVKCWIPITFTRQSDPNFSGTRPTNWLRPQDDAIHIHGIPLDEWVIVNLQSTGYYRVEYDFPTWYNIVNYLNSNDFEKIHVLNRAQILDDFYHLEFRRSDLVRFHMLTNYLHRETEYLAWASIFKFIDKIAIDNWSENIHSFKRQLVGLLTSAVKYQKFDEAIIDGPEEDDKHLDEYSKLARVLILKTARELGNSECKRIITEKSDNIPLSLIRSPNTRTIVLSREKTNENLQNGECVAAIDNTVLHNSFSENYESFVNLIDSATSDVQLFEDDYQTMYDFIVQKYANNDLILTCLLENMYGTLKKGYTEELILDKLIKNVYSAERLRQINDFVRDNDDFKLYRWTRDMIKNQMLKLRR